MISLIAKCKTTLLSAAEPSITDMCQRDCDILRNRLHALRLVKGGAESVAATLEAKGRSPGAPLHLKSPPV